MICIGEGNRVIFNIFCKIKLEAWQNKVTENQATHKQEQDTKIFEVKNSPMRKKRKGLSPIKTSTINNNIFTNFLLHNNL